MNELTKDYYCECTLKTCEPVSGCLDSIKPPHTCNHQKKKEYGRYCGTHPDTVREILPSGSEGLTIAGVVCLWRVFVSDSWQSMCSMENQEEMGCRKSNKEI
ncbi:MAG: hypothetical protein PHH85_09140 [Candidatus Methanoperedens sp.]|nr:hypothetical protein [Candidatus Methanoperedens sp.]